MNYYALIVAGGSGSRMNSDIPKQFLLLHQKPVLMHTIEAFYHSDLKPEIIVALHKDYFKYWNDLCKIHNFNIPHKLVEGGTERFHSVKNGLKELKEKSIVAIHDALRPLISNDLITRSFHEAREKGTAVAAVPSRDSIRQLQNDTSIALDRKTIFIVQTPQVFWSDALKVAYQQDFDSSFTDDASVVEKAGIKINLIQGELLNIKITYPEDIRIAELFFKEK
ncbi:MAG TPA: 2-C-methyl-D-erythritol 4-phosphate cytidylyltransferase [Sphingobacteriaceae bacterium]|nr:2-C-methyl-D-erythritol 4-phosphate cytidylyltransferase [Sphingobacteriaceae bacterium]